MRIFPYSKSGQYSALSLNFYPFPSTNPKNNLLPLHCPFSVIEYNKFLHPGTNSGDNHFGAQNKRPFYGRDRFQDFKFSSKSGAKSHYHSWEKDEGTELCRSKCARDKLRCDSSLWREKRRVNNSPSPCFQSLFPGEGTEGVSQSGVKELSSGDECLHLVEVPLESSKESSL
ncbi:hypothetical protein TNCT_66791 [Trichonephila clavata]|uniref:Uncharacterized protein n=1 Tax=Trichonephila clavata TaxID=2740835 RepID=A0A8X6HQT3_TRICU|nr:hypothetical protein TNCT_66791 [Trichonephila clavata]